MPHYLLIYLLLGILFGRIDALTKKQTYDIENITVFDYPDEDTCDYDIYLWEVLSADLHWEEDQIDYYKLFDVTPKTTPLSEVKESYRNTLAFWDSWCTLCNIKPHDKERGEKIIHKGYQTIIHPKKREAYEKEFKKEETKSKSTGFLSKFKRAREWLKTLGVFVVLGMIFYMVRKFRSNITGRPTRPMPKQTWKALNKGGSNIHTLKGKSR